MNALARLGTSSALLLLATTSCGRPPVEAPAAPAAAPPGAQPEAAARTVPRAQYNFVAAELALPLFWEADTNENGQADPEEIAVLWGLDETLRRDWVDGGRFTDRYHAAFARMADHHETPPRDGDARVVSLRRELAQGRPTLLRSDFSDANDQDRAIVQHVLRATTLIERLYMKQVGSWELRTKLANNEPAARTVFQRNQGPWCVAPSTENDPSCHAIAGAPKKVSGLYPASLQAKGSAFCDDLKKEKEAEKLRHQFYVVRMKGGSLTPIPYHLAYAEEMTAISKELRAAAKAIVTEDEKAFKTYLLAAAQAFTDDSWEAADEAWAKMNVHNSKWYLRIGPDEVYFEPCSLKAGFHVSFARINQGSLSWQRKLDPKKTAMEEALAKLAGPAYKARKVSFHLPDFIDIVLNAGDSRSPHGATIGQSLPNWGPVANEGRGRTVAMTNLYTDADSRTDLRTQASSLLCADTMKRFVDDPEPLVMSTVMHEAAHNLGPAHEYKTGGKTAREIFGGPMASTLEELKAQTAALFLPAALESAESGLIGGELVEQAHVRDIVWAFGHISRGMYDAQKRPKPYSQLAAIQLGFFAKHGAVEWRASEKTPSGTDTGCLSIATGKAFSGPVEDLMRQIMLIKAKGDVAGAKALVRDFVDAKEAQPLLESITERWLRAPKASFVYAIEM